MIEQNWLPSESSIFASGQCTHPYWRKGGSYKERQRWRCILCGKEHIDGAKPLMSPQERAIQLLPLYRAGHTVLEAARELGLSSSTVMKGFKELQKHIPRKARTRGTLWSRREIVVETLFEQE
ncbi:MAG: hypothetical protein WAN65_13365 [Candidatus Sulfotelmatobacter sp.]